jgi:catechol 2,3-dioxygenase-like lactoylglutathione lyase family enzyme
MPGPLGTAHTVTKLPAQDLERARAFYRDKLGLEPVEERTGGLRYVCGPTEFHLFGSAGEPSGESTQMAFEVEDLEATLADLRARGVTFERFEMTGFDVRGDTITAPITTRARAPASSARSSTTARATSLGSPSRSARAQHGISMPRP